jgi:hypothetical protein
MEKKEQKSVTNKKCCDQEDPQLPVDCPTDCSPTLAVCCRLTVSNNFKIDTDPVNASLLFDTNCLSFIKGVCDSTCNVNIPASCGGGTIPVPVQLNTFTAVGCIPLSVTLPAVGNNDCPSPIKGSISCYDTICVNQLICLTSSTGSAPNPCDITIKIDKINEPIISDCKTNCCGLTQDITVNLTITFPSCV